jgi:thiol:disulfide interchange protein DsbD
MKRVILLALALLAAANMTPGWDGGPTIAVKLIGPAEAFKPGAERTIFVEITIYPPFHINSHLPSDEFLVPTSVDFTLPDGVRIVKVDYPAGELKKFMFSESPLSVYEGTVRIAATLALSSDFSGREVRIDGSVGFQACDNNSCLAPDEAAFSEKYLLAEVETKPPVPAAPSDTTPKSAATLSRAETPVQSQPSSVSQSGAKDKAAVSSTAAQSLEGKGLLLTFLLVFLGGLALNLTPCVYPLIPITISYFGGQSGGKKGSLLGHALFYVMGMAVTYSLLGVIAAFTGSLLGSALQHPPVLIAIAAIMVVLALSMFDLYEIRIPGFLAKLAGGSRRGMFGTLFMGLTVGIVAAPCIGPFVLGLLTYVGDRGNVFLGFGLFFVLALGLGLPFVFLALFSGSINRLPRSGSWMVWVRKIFGFILIAMAVYFLKPLFPDPLTYGLAMALVMLVAGVYLAWIEPTRGQGKVLAVVRNLAGLAFFLACLIMAAAGIRSQIDLAVAEHSARLSQAASGVRWFPYDSERLNRAAADKKPVFIDFYADWCLPCRELDTKTFSAPEAADISARFVMLKANLTSSSAPLSRELTRKYKIKGVPTLVFIDAEGRERPDLRAVGFIDKEEFLKRMNKALAGKN